MPDHRMPGLFAPRGRRTYGPGRHSAGAALVPETEPALELQPVPGHVQGVPVGAPGRVSLELHLAAAAAGDGGDRSDGIWRV